MYTITYFKEVAMDNWFMIYVYISAGIVVINSYYNIFHSNGDDTYLEEIEIVADTFRVHKGWIIALLFIFLATFGWLILPVEVACEIIKYFSKEK